MTVTRDQRDALNFHLDALAARHGTTTRDPRIRAARRDAMLYVSEGASPREAVEWAEVHAFHLYNLDVDRADP